MEKFKKELENLINKHSIENMWDMPDFIMADMICDFIRTTGPHLKQNLDWHGCDSICHPAPNHLVDVGDTLTNYAKETSMEEIAEKFSKLRFDGEGTPKSKTPIQDALKEITPDQKDLKPIMRKMKDHLNRQPMMNLNWPKGTQDDETPDPVPIEPPGLSMQAQAMRIQHCEKMDCAHNDGLGDCMDIASLPFLITLHSNSTWTCSHMKIVELEREYDEDDTPDLHHPPKGRY